MVVRKIETAEKVWYCKTADLKTGIIIQEHRSEQGDEIDPSAFAVNDAVDTKKNQREDQSSVSKLGMFGDDEIESGKAKLKNMLSGTEKEVPLNEDFYDRFFSIYVNGANDTFMEKLGLSIEE